MDRNDFVRDDEVLYRSVRGKYGEEYSFDNGKLEITAYLININWCQISFNYRSFLLDSIYFYYSVSHKY